jgi:hypothetical protein
LSKDLLEAGIAETVKMLTVPMAKGKIMLRFENIADTFDTEAS